MKPACPALPLAAGFFRIWLGVLYLGADHPPPPGFARVLLLALAAAVLVFVRAPVYAGWQAVWQPRRPLPLRACAQPLRCLRRTPINPASAAPIRPRVPGTGTEACDSTENCHSPLQALHCQCWLS